MRIDIGGGTAPELGFTNLDPVHGDGPWKRMAQDVPWPCRNATATTVRASHVMEHIPAGKPRLDVMNEVHRVLEPGGRFYIFVPLFPYWEAIADPTHVSFWVRESFDYFCTPGIAQADYGIRYWDLHEYRESGHIAHVTLVKP